MPRQIWQSHFSASHDRGQTITVTLWGERTPWGLYGYTMLYRYTPQKNPKSHCITHDPRFVVPLKKWNQLLTGSTGTEFDATAARRRWHWEKGPRRGFVSQWGSIESWKLLNLGNVYQCFTMFSRSFLISHWNSHLGVYQSTFLEPKSEMGQHNLDSTARRVFFFSLRGMAFQSLARPIDKIETVLRIPTQTIRLPNSILWWGYDQIDPKANGIN